MKPKKRLKPLLTPDVNASQRPRQNPVACKRAAIRSARTKAVGALRVVTGWVA